MGDIDGLIKALTVGCMSIDYDLYDAKIKDKSAYSAVTGAISPVKQLVPLKKENDGNKAKPFKLY